MFYVCTVALDCYEVMFRGVIDSCFDSHFQESQAHLFGLVTGMGPSTSVALKRAPTLLLTAQCQCQPGPHTHTPRTGTGGYCGPMGFNAKDTIYMGRAND